MPSAPLQVLVRTGCPLNDEVCATPRILHSTERHMDHFGRQHPHGQSPYVEQFSSKPPAHRLGADRLRAASPVVRHTAVA